MLAVDAARQSAAPRKMGDQRHGPEGLDGRAKVVVVVPTRHRPLRERARGPKAAAGVVRPSAPLLVPPSAPGVPVKLGIGAFQQAKRSGLSVSGKPAQDTSCVTFGEVVWPAPSVRASSGPAWARARGWTPPGVPATQTAVPGSGGRAGPSKPMSSWTWAKSTRQHTLDELYDSAHVMFDAPLTTPMGLVNKGNSCFASVILQMLVYCRPLYRFLSLLQTMVPQDLSNSTPLLEAIYRFYSEIPLVPPGATAPVSDSDFLSPDYVYDAMKLHKRFDLFQLGHQEDAEEFLSSILSTLHEEVQQVYQRAKQRTASKTTRSSRPSNVGALSSAAPSATEGSDSDELYEVIRPPSPDEDEWLEVGQKGTTTLTRSSGTTDAPSPVTRLFDGKLRSSLVCPGSKTSVILEPYRSLPLDIQPNDVRSIEDALFHITEPETISGVWSQARHAFVDATKRVCIEALPPVLILHLKRFVYDDMYGVQKSTKPVQYGLTLEIDPEILSAPCRRTQPSTKYALFGVVFHHGRLASGGHYTVAVRRQDNSGWIHFDDTHAWPVPTEVILNGPHAPPYQGDAYLLFYQKMAV